MKKKKFKIISLILGLFLFSVIIIGCSQKSSSTSISHSTADSGSSSNTNEKVNGFGVSSDKPSSENTDSVSNKTSDTSGAAQVNNNSNTSNKIILSGSVQMETLKYEDTVKAITDYVASIGGYSENSTIQGSGINYSNTPQLRQASFVFRIPKDKFSEFFTGVKGFGTITSQQMSGKDVTETYVDTDAKINSLKVQEERLLELTKKAGQLNDVLQLEKELTSVRQQIDNLTTQLKTMDNEVTYSTVNITVQEVDTPTSLAPQKSKGLFERMGYGFTQSMKNLWTFIQNCLVFIVSALPFLIVIIILTVTVFYIYKLIKKLIEKFKSK
ncbi:MAG: DUF4349 domain-containing protein [Bacillota bacterium]|nr:DUF4349 domain-containing protein [Bacillota bacterium]